MFKIIVGFLSAIALVFSSAFMAAPAALAATAYAHNPPTGLHVVVSDYQYLQVAWNHTVGETSYTARLIQLNGVVVSSEIVHSASAYWSVHAGWQYNVQVWANPAKSGGPNDEVKVTIPSASVLTTPTNIYTNPLSASEIFLWVTETLHALSAPVTPVNINNLEVWFAWVPGVYGDYQWVNNDPIGFSFTRDGDVENTMLTFGNPASFIGDIAGYFTAYDPQSPVLVALRSSENLVGDTSPAIEQDLSNIVGTSSVASLPFTAAVEQCNLASCGLGH